jgi:LysM repeat protein
MKRKIPLALLVVIMLSLGIAALAAAQSKSNTIPVVEYRVQSGDTLAKIARKYCTTWEEIYDMNAGIIGADPSDLVPDTLIYIPHRCGAPPGPGGAPGVYERGPRLHANGEAIGNVYIAAPGDTLYSVGQRFGVPWEEIARVNNVQKLEPGQKIIIPGLAPAPQPPATSPSTKDFQPGECVLTPFQGAPSFTYPDGPQSGIFGVGGSWSAIKGVRMPSGEFWYMIDTEPSTSNPPEWVRAVDTAQTGDCSW